MDKNIEAYIDQITRQLPCDDNEKREIIDEMRDHLYLLKGEYFEKGLSDEEAVQKALKSFGEQNQLKNGYQESLFPFYKTFMIGTWILFVLYSFIVLFQLLIGRIIMRINDYAAGYPYNRFFSYLPESNGFFDIEVWQSNSNIIPFQNILFYLNGSEHFNNYIIINNTLGNILIFLPLGFFLPILFKKYNSLSKGLMISILISFSIEILQFVLQIGQFDIDDIILNTIGGVLGYFVFGTLRDITHLIKNKTFQKSTS